MHVRTQDGKDAVLYVNPSVTALMPSGLEEGRDYAFVVRDTFLTGNAPQFDLISYDLVRQSILQPDGIVWRRTNAAKETG